MDSQLRLSAKKLLYMSARYSEQDIKIDIGNMSHKHRIGVLRWLNENISNKDLTEHPSANDSVTLIERLLREHLERRSEGFHAKNKQFGDFIKLVHSNELITFLDIRAVLRDPAICSIYDGSEIRICDKQQLPLGRTLCNYTSVAMQVQPNEPLPDAHSCPCRNNNLLYQTTDLVDGHVVSCNPDLIKNVQVRKLFTYGAKFRQNVSADTILTSLEIGLDQYVAYQMLKYSFDSSLHRKLSQWQNMVYEKCQMNLKNYMQQHPDPFVKDHCTENFIRSMKEVFTICPVDKTSHNLAYVCQAYYKYVDSKELRTKAYSEVSDRSYEEILDAHREWNRKHKYPHTDAFQYLYPIPKMKNLPQIKWRFLAGVASPQQQQYRRPDAANIRATYDRKPHEANCSTTPASKHLSHQLQIVMHILQLKDNELYNKTGI